MTHHKRPILTDIQRTENAAYASRKYKENMKRRGYALVNIYVPNPIKREVRAKVRRLIDEYEKRH